MFGYQLKRTSCTASKQDSEVVFSSSYLSEWSCFELLPWLCSVIQKLYACGRRTGDEIDRPEIKCGYLATSRATFRLGIEGHGLVGSELVRLVIGDV